VIKKVILLHCISAKYLFSEGKDKQRRRNKFLKAKFMSLEVPLSTALQYSKIQAKKERFQKKKKNRRIIVLKLVTTQQARCLQGRELFRRVERTGEDEDDKLIRVAARSRIGVRCRLRR
jgi:hypothetical protein